MDRSYDWSFLLDYPPFPNLKCPLTQEWIWDLEEPISNGGCDHIYERDAVESWLLLTNPPHKCLAAGCASELWPQTFMPRNWYAEMAELRRMADACTAGDVSHTRERFRAIWVDRVAGEAAEAERLRSLRQTLEDERAALARVREQTVQLDGRPSEGSGQVAE